MSRSFVRSCVRAFVRACMRCKHASERAANTQTTNTHVTDGRTDDGRTHPHHHRHRPTDRLSVSQSAVAQRETVRRPSVSGRLTDCRLIDNALSLSLSLTAHSLTPSQCTHSLPPSFLPSSLPSPISQPSVIRHSSFVISHQSSFTHIHIKQSRKVMNPKSQIPTNPTNPNKSQIHE